MKRIVSGLATAALVCGVGVAGLAASRAHATIDTGPGHGIFCTVTGDCSDR